MNSCFLQETYIQHGLAVEKILKSCLDKGEDFCGEAFDNLKQAHGLLRIQHEEIPEESCEEEGSGDDDSSEEEDSPEIASESEKDSEEGSEQEEEEQEEAEPNRGKRKRVGVSKCSLATKKAKAVQGKR